MTRNDIINAAFNVWGRGFYKTTSLSELAKALGVSKAALYRHFPDKDALFEAMNSRFFDDYAEALKPEMDRARTVSDKREKLLIMLRIIIKYFAGNFSFFIFVLFAMNKTGKPGFHLKRFLMEVEKRGIKFPFLGKVPIPKNEYPSLAFLAGMTVFFGVKLLYTKYRDPNISLTEGVLMEISLTEEELRSSVDSTVEKIWRGLRFDKNLIDGVPFEKLEGLAAGLAKSPEGDPLLKAVAEVVAEAGPWRASMETVARRSGLSKSGLYAHFRSKRDMLSRLFMTEFERIAEIAAACSGLSPLWEERLYLVIFSVTEYLRSRPEVLVTMDWVRIQRLELDISLPLQLHDFFSGLTVDLDISSTDISEWVFLLIGIMLMRYYHSENSLDLPNEALRKLFRFVSLGVEGFLNSGGNGKRTAGRGGSQKQERASK
ncbi:MAG: TetR/AcrR family transcriptional regulator [Treponema sp.]|jgi:AcrR family transcriptional regulator|nr:TetR/AcrR family transcriptional regulator [Treponema sp.]